MTYDLVIIGATQAGLRLAQAAIAERLRVALVQQVDQPLGDIQFQVLQKVLLEPPIKQGLTALREKLAQAIAPTDFYEPLAKLAEMGVDVILEKGAFRWQPEQYFVTETRQLQAKHYAIATGYGWAQNPDQDLIPTDLLALETWENLAETVAIVGKAPALIHLAYGLAQWGKRVQLIYRGRLFPTEDPQLAHRIQTFLELAGIEIYRDLSEAEQSELLQQENVSIVRGDRQGMTTQLNLPPDCLHRGQLFLKVNAQLQTVAPNIYGCGAVLGGYDLPELAIAEGNFLAQHFQKPSTNTSVNICPYLTTPYRLFAPSPFDHVGYQDHNAPPATQTETEVITLDRVDQGQFPWDLTLKVWFTPDRQLLGATVIGDRTGKLIYHCRELIQHQGKFVSWQNLLAGAGLLAELCWR